MSLFISLCLVFSLCTTIGETIESREFTLSTQSPPTFKAPSPNAPAAHVLNLTGKAAIPKSAGYLQSIRKGNPVNGVYGLTKVTLGIGQQAFLADIEFGTQSFQATIDTGSSDTWLAGTGFQCIDETTGAHLPESQCMFGPTYTISPTFKRIANENFNETYLDSTYVNGIYGHETVTIAGIPVQKQQVAVVNDAAYIADGVSSGLIGFAFPDETSAYAGTIPAMDTKGIAYNPILTTLFSKGYVAPLFSLALERSSETSGFAAGGLLAIGGLPPVRFSPTFASAPFQLVAVNELNHPGAAKPQYQFYTVIINGFTYRRSQEPSWTHPNPFDPPTNKSRTPVLIDSGTSLILLPTAFAIAVNALFDPPALYYANAGAFYTNCLAKAPEFGVQIGEQTFFLNAKDLIIIARSAEGTLCPTSIGDAGYGPSVLGAPFLKNVLAVFDVGASEMRFAAREFYRTIP